MKGITPVIAIILLLLMAVAAAGGFYYVYQGFTSEGEASGSEQIESLGEQALSALTIESAAGGRLYVRNVGASSLDLSQATVYVENVPYNVNRSTDRLEEKERAVLKFTQAPSCSAEACEVRISGPASTSRSVDSEKLVCSSDSDCLSSESCEGGVCQEEVPDNEIFFGTTIEAEPRVMFFSYSNRTVENMSDFFAEGTVLASHSADFDGDDREEILFGSQDDAGAGFTRFGWIDGERGSWTNETLFFNYDGAGAATFQATDADSDGEIEGVSAGMSSTFNLSVWDWTGSTFSETLLNHTEWTMGGCITPNTEDFDNDGKNEVACVMRPASLPGYFVIYEYDGSWQRTHVNTTPSLLFVTSSGETDGDGYPEVIAGDHVGPVEAWADGAILKYEQGESGWEELQIVGKEEPSEQVLPAVGDVDGDGLDEIVIGNQAAGLFLYDWDGSSYARTELNTTPGRFIFPNVGDYDNDGENEIVVPDNPGPSPEDGRILGYKLVDGSWEEEILLSGIATSAVGIGDIT